jgi:hypothetical protein
MRVLAASVGVTALALILSAPRTAPAQTSTTQTATAQTSASLPTHPKKKPPLPPVQRSAAGTVIQPTRTIIHNPNGTTTVIVVPRRSYLDPGTEVPVGYPGTRDYVFPPGGDPGRPYWYFGPDTAGVGGTPLAQPWLIPGFNPGSPLPY